MSFNPVTSDKKEFDKKFPPTMDPVIFKSKGEKIVGTMFIADGEGPHPTILLLHGFPGNETNSDLAHTFKRAGFNVLIFHYRGTWGSSGEFSFENGVEDTKSAIQFLKNPEVAKLYRINRNDIRIIGYSMGGFFGFYNALLSEDIKKIAFIAGFNFGFFAKMLPKIDGAEEMTLENLKKGSAILSNANPEKLFSEIKNNSENWDLTTFTEKMKEKDILLISAKYDTIAPVEIHHQPLVQILKSNNIKFDEKMLETGHGLANKRIELATGLVNWLIKN